VIRETITWGVEEMWCCNVLWVLSCTSVIYLSYASCLLYHTNFSCTPTYALIYEEPSQNLLKMCILDFLRSFKESQSMHTLIRGGFVASKATKILVSTLCLSLSKSCCHQSSKKTDIECASKPPCWVLVDDNKPLKKPTCFVKCVNNL
jgi:hypothetical protein